MPRADRTPGPMSRLSRRCPTIRRTLAVDDDASRVSTRTVGDWVGFRAVVVRAVVVFRVVDRVVMVGYGDRYLARRRRR